MTEISYGLSSTAWNCVIKDIENIIIDGQYRKVIEIGGGANPTLSTEFILRHRIEYTLLDISQSELDKAPADYLKICADICESNFVCDEKYDFAFSRMLAEHVSSGERFHRNVKSLLRVQGVAFHFFPTMFAPPFVVNYLLPERLAESVLHLMQPGRERSGKVGKFPARYSWCRGPSRSQVQRFESLGYEVKKYSGFFGHEPYYRKIPFIHYLHLKVCNYLYKHPVVMLTSFAQVILMRVW